MRGDGQVVGVVELLHLGPLRRAQARHHRTGLCDRARHHLARGLVARVLRHRGAAVLDEALQIEHGVESPR